VATKAGTLQVRGIPATKEESRPAARGLGHRLVALWARSRSEATERKALEGWGARAELGRETGVRC
jgi:hypothetical protein